MPARAAAKPKRAGGRARPAAAPPPSGAPTGLPMGEGKARHPELGFGLWNLGRWEHEEERRARATLDRALERAIPWVDTAEVYGAGRSERIVGDALARRGAGAPRPFVTTKVSWEHLRAAQVRASLIGSRQRLGLPKVDLYLVHAPDPHVPLRETMGAMEALYKDGAIGGIGVSNFSVEELEAAQAALSEARILVNQVRFNLFEREDAEPVLDYCRAHQIVLEAYTPTSRGLLAGRFLTGEGPPKGDVRHGRGLFASDRFPDYQRRAQRLAELAEDAGVPPAALALRWLAGQGVAPVFGASSPEQVDATLEAWAARPDAGTLARADRIARGDAS